MSDTYLSHAITATNDAGAAYDANAKYLLADKQVLAWILKYAVSEFFDMDIPAIISCIEDTIEIGSKSVDPGLSGTGRISGTATEDHIPGEGLIFFDIRFSAYLMNKEIKFLTNVEAQKSSAPAKLGYHLENRILFYLSRMVSAQKQTEFFHSDFDSLKRVLSKNYGMTMTAEFERRIRIMCNLSEAIKEDAMKSGYEKGMEKGMERGIEKERLTAIHRMIRAGASRKQILSYGYTPDEYVQAEHMML